MKLLWLDDIRNPEDEQWKNYIDKYIIHPLTVKIIWLKDYYEFKYYLENNDLPYIISFDHDLSDIHCNKSTYKEKTGMTCAKWLVDYCIDNNLKLPNWYVHSANPVGAENIRKYLENYEKREL